MLVHNFPGLTKEEGSKVKIYFREITVLMYIKIVKFGETILPAMSISFSLCFSMLVELHNKHRQKEKGEKAQIEIKLQEVKARIGLIEGKFLALIGRDSASSRRLLSGKSSLSPSSAKTKSKEIYFIISSYTFPFRMIILIDLSIHL